jgi:uncharacterized protein
VRRVVVDTGVLVAGMYWRTEPHQVLRAWLRGAFNLVVTEEIWAEYLDVAWRVKLKEALAASPAEWLRLVQIRADWAEPAVLEAQVGRDPKDQCFFRAAVGGNASVIVARDPHFTAMERPWGITILTPRQFLNTVPRELRGKD